MDRGLLFVAALQLGGCTATSSRLTPGGPYGLARLPPMGWRSWNAFHDSVTQDKMVGIMNAMVQKQHDGRSFLDLGFQSVGLDDGWQSCGAGYHGSFHDELGHPLWNKTKFPDPAILVSNAHRLSLKAGWYMNNCECKEWEGIHNASWADSVYQQSVAMLVEQKWDGVKLDSCSMFHNTTHWATLMEQSGRPISIENCVNTHNPTPVPDKRWGHDGQCPYNWFRISTDIRANWGSILNNLAAVVPYTSNLTHPMSVPGCWAYPDMMEVGNLATPEEDRAHFGAWCIVSSPLILGCDLSDTNITAKIWPIVSNAEAIAVNQQYVGHPGRLITAWNRDPPTPSRTVDGYLRVTDCKRGSPSQPEFVFDHVTGTIRTTTRTGRLHVRDNGGINSSQCVDGFVHEQLVLRQCDDSVGQRFKQVPGQAGYMFIASSTHPSRAKSGTDGTQCVGVGEQPKYCSVLPCEQGGPLELQTCHNGSHTQEYGFTADEQLQTKQRGPPQCVEVTDSPEDNPLRSGKIVLQSQFSLWAKPQPAGAVAVFLLSNQDSKTDASVVAMNFTQIGLPVSVTRVLVRDLWAHKDIGLFSGGSFVSDRIGGHDSRFYLFKPV